MTPEQRHQVLLSMNTANDRIKAWRDNAKQMLLSALPQDEERWRNEYDNYNYVSSCLNVAQTIVLAEN